jgi:hypothetical protein
MFPAAGIENISYMLPGYTVLLGKLAVKQPGSISPTLASFFLCGLPALAYLFNLLGGQATAPVQLSTGRKSVSASVLPVLSFGKPLQVVQTIIQLITVFVVAIVFWAWLGAYKSLCNHFVDSLVGDFVFLAKKQRVIPVVVFCLSKFSVFSFAKAANIA